MQPSDLLADRFLIERLAGSGGHGRVYAAHDRHTGDRVAVKVLHGSDPDRGARFAREALVLSELVHPAIVRYVAHGTTSEGERFLAMEWLGGESLAKALTRGPMEVADVVRFGARVADALLAAHKKGITHRDLKPSNLILVDDDVRRAKLVDFGIARVAASGRQLTLTGTVLGTPGYVAPEQARGQRDVGPAADVFALGCVLFKCLTGHTPFEGDDVLAVLLKVVLESPPRLSEVRPGVPPELDELVASMLAKQPADRPDDAAVAAALAAMSEPTEQKPPAFGDAPRGLGTAERRVLCLVLARPAPEPRVALGMTVPAPPPPSPTSDGAPTATMTQIVPSGFLGDAGEQEHSLTDVVARHHGRLDVLADGTLLVTLGAGETRVRDETGETSFRGAHEAATDHAARAARCALALRSVLRDGPMVLVAGQAVVPGRVPIGEVIERGVRLLGHATTGGVRLDEVAAGLLDARYDVRGDPLGLILSGEREAPEALRTLLGKPTPCVGRDRELATLDAFYDECVDEPVGRVVLVSAAAGVGKSRVRFEFLQRLGARREPAEVLLARGDPMSAGSPFAMLAQAIRRAAGLHEGEPAAVRRRKLRARVGRHLQGGEATRVAHFLGELVGAVDDNEARDVAPHEAPSSPRPARRDLVAVGDQMRRAFEDWLRAETSAGPVVIVLEDLHWGDRPTVSFVDTALRLLATAPLLVVALARPEVHELFPDLWIERGMQEIRLGELTRKGSVRLVREVLGDRIDEAEAIKLAARAGGNAFYLEELIRAVAEGKSTAGELPETVLAMVQSRVEALEPDARRILRAGAVFGQVFWLGGVGALLGADSTTLLGEWLAVLADREVVSVRGVGKFPGEPEYAFRHALVREAAYAMLTDGDRALGHSLAAQWLERAGERDARLLAEHAERGGDGPRAVAWYRRAVVQALEGNDLAAVITEVERAVALGASGTALGELRLRQAEAYRWQARFAEAERAALDALDLLPPDDELALGALGEVVLAAGRLGHVDRLATIVARLVGSPATLSGGTFLVTLAQAAGVVYFFGRHDLAEPLFRRIEALEEELTHHDPAVLAWIHRARALRAVTVGDAGEYLRLMKLTADAYEQAGDLRSACGQRVNVGYAFMGIGAYREAEAELRGAIVLAERMGLHNVVATARNNLGLALARSGHLDEARRVELDAVQAGTDQGDRRMEGASRTYLAIILSLAGQHDAAEREAAAAVRILEVAPPARAHALGVLANTLLARARARATGDEGGADIAAALAATREAMSLLETLGSVEEGEGAVRLAHAEALAAAGERAEAQAAIAAAQRRVLERADKITDPEWRRSFLDRVPENAKTLALAAAWCAG